MYAPADHMLWDFWTAEQVGLFHLFYLKAPRDLPDPEMRHARAILGHATSRDLRSWRDEGTILEPGPEGAWDDRATWTGSVLRLEDGRWAMLYTGTCKGEGGRVQRVGLALSRDLQHWEKHPANPVIEADPALYEEADEAPDRETAWRDPWLARDGAGGYVAYITARLRRGEPGGRGCIALARSTDLVRWHVEPPVAAPGRFFHMEIPQLWREGGRDYLLFNAKGAWVVAAEGGDDEPVPAVTGTFYLVRDERTGGWRYGGVLAGDASGTRFGVKLLRGPDGRPTALCWLGYTPEGRFVGALGDPMPITVDAAGRLSVDLDASGTGPAG